MATVSQIAAPRRQDRRRQEKDGRREGGRIPLSSIQNEHPTKEGWGKHQIFLMGKVFGMVFGRLPGRGSAGFSGFILLLLHKPPLPPRKSPKAAPLPPPPPKKTTKKRKRFSGECFQGGGSLCHLCVTSLSRTICRPCVHSASERSPIPKAMLSHLEGHLGPSGALLEPCWIILGAPNDPRPPPVHAQGSGVGGESLTP